MSSEVPRLPRFMWVVAFIGFVALVAMAYAVLQKSRPFVSPLTKYAPAPEFSLTTQDGKTLTKEDLKGKVWVVDFIFTRCAGPCPVMTGQMAALNKELGPDAKDVKLVTITVDPENDTPEVLKKYGERFGATDRWTFLTGKKDEIDTLTVKGFLQPLGKDKEGMPEHSSRFILVDKDGWIRGFHDMNDPEFQQKLLVDIGSLLRESGNTP